MNKPTEVDLLLDDCEKVMTNKLAPSAMLDVVHRFGQKRVEQNGKLPCFVAIYPDGLWFQEMTFSDDAEKAKVTEDAFKNLQSLNAIIIFLTADTWTADANWNERPSLAPNKKQVVITQVISKYGITCASSWSKYTRKNGHISWAETENFWICSKQSFIKPWVSSLEIVAEELRKN